MIKYKVKKIKITYFEKNLFILTLPLVLITIFFLLIASKNNLISYSTPKINNINNNNFKGELISKKELDDKYIQLIYKNNNELHSHIIDIKKKKKINVNSIIKDKEKFNNILRELLLKKYPSKFVNKLINEKKEFLFYEEYLYIEFNTPDKLNTKIDFNIKINYKYIKDLFKITLPKGKDFPDEDGYNYDPNKVTISITLDDGPNGEKTEKILSYLEDYKMSATFFMLGNKIENSAEIVKKVYDSHSEIGYHSYKHEYLTKQSSEEILKEYELSNNIYKQITGDNLKLIRAPYGAYNKKILNTLQIPFIEWSIDTNDWRYKDSEYLLNHVLDNYENGSIILFHDSYETSVEAINTLLEELYLREIQVVKISKLAELHQIKLEKGHIYFTI